MPPKKKPEKVSSGPLDNFFSTAGASSKSSKGKAKADSADDESIGYVPAKRPKHVSTAARKKTRVVRDEDSEIEIVLSKPASKKTRVVLSDEGSDIEIVAPRRVLRKARASISDDDSEPEIVSTRISTAGPSTTSTSAAIEISSDEECATQRKTALKRGGRKYDDNTKRVVNDAKNAKRREDRQNPDGAYQLSKWQKDIEKSAKRIDAYSAFLVEEFDRRLDNFLEVQAVLSDSTMTPMQTIQTITNTTRRQHSAHTIPPDHALWDKLAPVHDFLKVFSANPFQFDPAPFVASGVLVEDAPDGQTRQEREKQVAKLDKYAKLYLRLYRIENGGPVLCDFCRQYPASAVQVVLMLVFMGWPLEQIKDQMNPFLSVAGLGEVITRLFQHICASRVGEVLTGTFEGTTIWLPYFGLNIVGTPYFRSILGEEDTGTLLSNFLSLGQHDSPKIYVVDALKVQAESAMDMRTNPLISFLEVALIAHGRGLTLNSHHGGWIPDYQPRQELLDAALAIQVPTSSSLPLVRDDALVSAANNLIDDEACFWRTYYRNHNRPAPFVDATVTYTKTNYSSCLALVKSELPLAVIAKDVTVEELDGRAGPRNSQTAGRSLQEDRRIQLILDGLCNHDNSEPQPEVPFLDLFRITPKIHREFNVAFLSLHMLATKPILITTWGNAVSYSFRQKEVQSILEQRDDSPALFSEHVSLFLSGTRSVEVLTGIRDNVKERHPIDWFERREGVFIESLGTPGIVQYSPEPSALSVEIPTFDPGCFKYDPLLAVTERDLYFLVAAKVRLAKSLLIEDLCTNGAMPRNQPDVMERRLLAVMDAIETRCKLTGFNDLVECLKTSHSCRSSAVTSLRLLASRLRGGCQQGSDTSSCSEEEEEDEEEETSSGSGSASRTKGLRAAAGCDARVTQLQELRNERDVSLRRKLPDPTRKYVLRGMTLDDPRYEVWFLALEDGVTIHRSRNATNRDIPHPDESPEEEARRLSAKSNIGQWSANNKVQRSLDPSNNIDRVGERLRRAATNLSTMSQPSLWMNKKRASNVSEGWRAALCKHCCSWTVGEGQGTTHYCTTKKGKNTITPDDDNFSRFDFVHDVFEHGDLASLVGAEPKDLGLFSKSVSEVLSTQANHTRSLSLFPPSTGINIAALEASSGQVYFSRTDSKNEDYLYKMALDLAFQHIWTNVGDFDSLRPSQQMAAWGSPGSVKCLKFFKGVKLTVPAGKQLVVTRCKDETVYVTTEANSTANGWSFRHKCSILSSKGIHGRDWHQGVQGREVNSIAELPLQYARRVLFDHLFPGFIGTRTKYRPE